MSPANTFHHLPEPDAAEGTPQASFRPDSEQIPLIEKAMQHDLQFVQRAGDVVWIPSGWWCALCHYWGFLLYFSLSNFPDVCPEPVLVNARCPQETWAQRLFCTCS
jgi:hypothetical protein